MIEIFHTRKNARQVYDNIFQHKGVRIFDSFYLWLLEIIEPRAGSVFLDISCGEGRLVELAYLYYNVAQAIGLDFSSCAIMKGKQRCSQVHWVVGDGEHLPFPDHSVDYVAHIGSLEHYSNPIWGIKEIVRVLKPDGKACILLPNAYGLLGNVQHVWKTGEVFDDGQPIQRYATRCTWETLLTAGGLVVEKVIPYHEVNRPRTLRDVAIFIKSPQKIVKISLSWFIPLNLSNHFVFICTTKNPCV